MSRPAALVAVATLATLFALSACQPAIPAYSVDVPPRLAEVRPPRSVAFVRGDVPLGGAQRAIEGAIPAEISGSKKTSLLGLREVLVAWRLARRPVALRAEKDNLKLEVALLGEITVEGDGVHCRADDAGVAFRVDVSPTLRPGGELSFDHLKWSPEPRGTLVCGAIPVPIGPLLEAAVDPIAALLARGVSQIRVPLAPALQAGLDALRSPRALPLGKEGEACLDLDPSGFVLAPVGGAGSEMTLRVGVDVAPRVVLGSCAGNPAARPHPEDALVAVKPLDDDFRVALAVAVPYAELSRIAAPKLVGQRFGEGDRAVVIDGLQIGDASGRVLVRAPIRGKLTGMLTLWGTPTLTEVFGRWKLRVPDLHVALESRSFLQELMLVAWKLKDGGLEAMMRSLVDLDVTDRLAEASAKLSGRHEITAGPPAVVLTTALTRLLPGEVSSLPGTLVLHPLLEGRADLTIETKPAPQ